MRPRELSEFVGQGQILGPGRLLTRLLQADRLGSLMLYGPPGSGKTALAHLLAKHTSCRFQAINAVASSLKELREKLAQACSILESSGQRTILFIDELHHFNRTQQDVLLPDVEEGRVVLVGATTQNPYFALNSPLLSRSQILALQPLSVEEIKVLLRRALADTERGLGTIEVQVDESALDLLAERSDGDARRALNGLEVAVLSSPTRPVTLDAAAIRDSIQRKALDYDATGDTHYDVVSAFIKSMRGSDPDAAIYWLARMLESGEEPRFIARRVLICASEDVGNADPHALSVAAAAVQAVEFLGMPECQLSLAQAVTYIAAAPKSNASTIAISEAMKEIQSGRVLPVPAHLRDSHYGGAAQLGHGAGYQYSHDAEGGWVDQEYLPEPRNYYRPVDRGFEKVIRERLAEIKSKKKGPAGGKPHPSEGQPE